MSDDLVELLLDGVCPCGMHDDNETELFDIDYANEVMAAAAERVKQLEDALRPFATVALELPDIVLNDDLVVIETFKIQVPASAFYTARSLLNGGSNEPE